MQTKVAFERWKSLSSFVIKTDALFFISFFILILTRYAIGLLFFSHFVTEDVYSNAIFSSTIFRTGNLYNEFSLIEARVQDLPPLIAVLGALMANFGINDIEKCYHLLPYLFQFFTLMAIYLIGKELISNNISGFTFSIIYIFSAYNLLWITSFSPVDSAMVMLSSISSYFFIKYLTNNNLMYFILSFATCGTLSMAHNFGNIFAAFLILSFILIILIRERTIIAPFKLSNLKFVIIGPLVWIIFGGIFTLIKSLSIYLPGIDYNLSGGNTSYGLDYLEIIWNFFPQLIIITAILGCSIVLLKMKKDQLGILFIIWLFFNIIALMIIPVSYSHKSRYPFQFIPALALLSGVFIFYIYSWTARVKHKKIANGIKTIFIAFVLILLIVPIYNSIPDYNNYKRWVSESYGLREQMGDYMREEIGEARIMYIYWPSFVLHYSEVPVSCLTDYSIIIQNSENLARTFTEDQTEYFIYDSLSGYYYHYPSIALRLVDCPFIDLEVENKFNSKAIIYSTNISDGLNWVTYDIDTLQGLNLSDAEEYIINEDAHGIIKQKTISYKQPINTDCHLIIPDDGSIEGAISIFLKIKMTPDAKFNATLWSKDSLVGNLTVNGGHLKGWEWFFEFYRIDVQDKIKSDLTIKITDIQGSVWISDVDVVYE
ncbi:hypothetical protein DSECCO2_600000 [anaerobic digester metagenome]